MRDLFMLAVLPLLLYAVIKRPFIAIGLWVWTSLFYPNAWVYGAAGSIRYNLLFTSLGVLSYLAMKDKPKMRFSPVGVGILLFLLWTLLSTVMGMGNPELQWDIWNRFAKVVLLFVFVILVVDKKLHVDFLLWCVVLSIGFYGCVEGLKFLATGGGHMITGFRGHVLGDRNELAVAFVMTLPICFYLLNEYGKDSHVVKFGLIGVISLLVVSVIGTQSRGGFISLAVLGGYLFLKSERKVLLGIFIVILVLVMASLAPEEWTTRINTIESANEDASFMGRVVAWKLSMILAIQNPLFGGGFKAIENFEIWTQVSRSFFSYPWFYTGDALPAENRTHAAHSVYFQVLGDHGFVGLGLYLFCLAGSFLSARAITRKARKLEAPVWVQNVGTMLQLSIFAFALGGAALSFAYFDLIFALFGLTLVLERRILPALTAGAKP